MLNKPFVATIVVPHGISAVEIYRHKDSTLYCRRDDVAIVLQGLLDGRPAESLPVWFDPDEADDEIRQEYIDAENAAKYW